MTTFANFTDPLHGHCSPNSLRKIPKRCIVAPPGGHIDVLDLSVRGGRQLAESKQLRFSDSEALTRYLRNEGPGLKTRIFFITQKDPRLALNTSTDLLQPIVDRYRITPLFLDLVSSFTRGVVRIDDGYCSPIRTAKGKDSLELCYVYKYVEMKPPTHTTEGRDPWEIRKTGVYHRLDQRTMHSIWIILSPMPASLGELRLRECMQSQIAQERISGSPFYAHAVLISCYLPNWHQYCTHLEKDLGAVSRRVMTIDLDSDFDISHETLRQTNYLKQKLLPLRSTFAALGLMLDTLEHIVRSDFGADREEEVATTLCNLRNESLAYAENAKYLLQLSERIRMQTSDTLTIKNQDIYVQQNNQLFELARASASDSLSIRVITILTLIYLPFSFVATVMSMCFFEMDVSSNKIIVSSQLWVFFCVSFPLATLTLVLWRYIMVRRSPLSGNKPEDAAHNLPEKRV